MEDVLGYAGKRVVVTGASSGMGEAASRILLDLDAELTARDIKPTAVPVARGVLRPLREQHPARL
jgi:NAD(P)-dependent dehydrogenase (short-subunit alcohol dehydrogenase family)